jgi:hypothetical protein
LIEMLGVIFESKFGQRPYYTVRLRSADDRKLAELLAALGPARPNPQYARAAIWREEG